VGFRRKGGKNEAIQESPDRRSTHLSDCISNELVVRRVRRLGKLMLKPQPFEIAFVRDRRLMLWAARKQAFP
jgi:hypothetical protein